MLIASKGLTRTAPVLNTVADRTGVSAAVSAQDTPGKRRTEKSQPAAASLCSRLISSAMSIS